jgi:hypothetical protein
MATVEELYQKAFGRTPGADEAAWWNQSGYSGADLEKQILGAAQGSDRTAALSNVYTDLYSRPADTSTGDSWWLDDANWSANASGGLDQFTRAIGNSAVDTDEFRIMANLSNGPNQGTRIDTFFNPDNANYLWKSLLDDDGFNMDMLKQDLPKTPTGGGGGGGAKTYQDYLNPYLDEVLDNSIRRIDEEGQRSRNRLGTSAFAAGAYGDARHGIESDNLNQSLMEAIGDLSSQVKAQGYESSMGWLNNDLNRQASTAFQNAGLQNQWMSNNANFANMGNNMGLTDYQATTDWLGNLQGFDQYDRNWTQNDLNADYTDFWARENWDQNQLTSLINVLNGIPGQVGSSSTGSASTPNNQSFGDLGAFLSAALGGGGATGALKPAGT